VALQGHRWFLGGIYGYREAGVHFGVPISNYLGWWVTSICLVLAIQIIDAKAGNVAERPAGIRSLPFRALLGPLLYLSVIVFNLAITLLIGERLMATTGVFIYTLPVVMAAVLIFRRTNRYSRDEIAEHMRDYPWSAAAGK